MRRLRILVLQHHPREHPGTLSDVLTLAGAHLELTPLYDGAPCPALLAGYDGLLVMGGPMGVGDEAKHSWLPAERALIAHAIDTDRPTLGICLGAEQIAAAAGARIAPGPVDEIGWHRITPTPAARRDPLFGDTTPFSALEWHRDAFTLPPGATCLASSAAYPVQAFRLRRHIYALLFHLEVGSTMVGTWCETFISGAPLPRGDATPDYVGANRRAARMATRLFLER